MVELEFFITDSSELCLILQGNRSDSNSILGVCKVLCALSCDDQSSVGKGKRYKGSRKQSLLYSRVLGGGRGVSLNAMRVSGKQQILVRWQKTVKGKVEARTFIGFFRKGKEGCGR